MAGLVFEVTIDDGESEPRVLELPGKHVVCGTCEGHGTHLRPGMRDHAYTAEEFAESFDEESAAEYFRRGGIYDVQCETCKGLRVVVVIDRGAVVTAEQREALAAWKEQERDRREYEALCRSEARYGC